MIWFPSDPISTHNQQLGSTIFQPQEIDSKFTFNCNIVDQSDFSYASGHWHWVDLLRDRIAHGKSIFKCLQTAALDSMIRCPPTRAIDRGEELRTEQDESKQWPGKLTNLNQMDHSESVLNIMNRIRFNPVIKFYTWHIILLLIPSRWSSFNFIANITHLDVWGCLVVWNNVSVVFDFRESINCLPFSAILEMFCLFALEELLGTYLWSTKLT